MSEWKSLWACKDGEAPKPPEGYKVEYMYSSYDGYAIKYRHVKDVK